MAVVEGDKKQEELIPGLPNEIAELCLLHVPYPYQALSRSVSSTWNRAITHPSFIFSKKTLSHSHPQLFVLAFHSQTAKIQWQALDPSSGRWFVLPQMPLPENTCQAAYAFACASLPRQGKLFVMGAAGSDTLVYRAATNQWGAAAAMPGGRGLLAAEEVEGRIVAVGRGGTNIYDPESDTWREMGIGMREGWSGVSVAVGGRVFVIPEYGDAGVKVYDEDCDTWRNVKGGRFPREVIKRPFCATGLEDRIYVASFGLNMAIGSIINNESQGKYLEVSMTWEVVEAPRAFRELSPCSCQVLYA